MHSFPAGRGRRWSEHDEARQAGSPPFRGIISRMRQIHSFGDIAEKWFRFPPIPPHVLGSLRVCAEVIVVADSSAGSAGLSFLLLGGDLRGLVLDPESGLRERARAVGFFKSLAYPLELARPLGRDVYFYS